MTETPIACETCGHIDWKNPIPVVTVIQPVRCSGSGRVGLAMAKRADPPNVGKWALIGGHVEAGQTLEQAAVLEWEQETGLTITEDELIYVGSHIASNGKLLVGFTTPTISVTHWSTARLCHENLEFGILWSRDQIKELCFPIHQSFALLFFDGLIG